MKLKKKNKKKKNKKITYSPCPGCGETNPNKACINCAHFGG